MVPWLFKCGYQCQQSFIQFESERRKTEREREIISHHCRRGGACSDTWGSAPPSRWRPQTWSRWDTWTLEEREVWWVDGRKAEHRHTQKGPRHKDEDCNQLLPVPLGPPGFPESLTFIDFQIQQRLSIPPAAEARVTQLFTLDWAHQWHTWFAEHTWFARPGGGLRYPTAQ